MKILNFKFKNFASYGNKFQVIDLPENGSLFVVKGSNGSGKSTISNALKYSLYGKVDGIKLGDLPNRLNNNLEVECSILKNGITYKIMRGINPNYLKLFINGVEYDQAGKKNIQEYIEEEILGIPFYLFNNTLSLSINDFKSFLTMSPNDKRMILDRIFGLEIINDIKKFISLQTKELRDRIEKMNYEIEILKNNNQKTIEELKNLELELLDFNKKNREDAENAILEYKNQINSLIEKREEILKKKNEYLEILNKGNTILNELKWKRKDCEHNIKLLNNKKCPTCGNNLDTEYYREILQKSISDNEKYQKEIKIVEEKVKNRKDLILELDNEFYSINDKINNIKILIDSLIKDENNQKNISNEKLDFLRNLIQKSNKELEELEKNFIKINKKNKFYSIIEEIFGDNGIKKMNINKKILPLLNKEIKNSLELLNIDYSINFLNDFGTEIKNLGFDINPEQLSTGEKKKIDFAVLISIIRLLKLRYTGINIVYLDEIFSSIDADGIHHILKVLKRLTKELDINIFVINHGNLTNHLFDYQINVEKTNNFSNLFIEKLS